MTAELQDGTETSASQDSVVCQVAVESGATSLASTGLTAVPADLPSDSTDVDLSFNSISSLAASLTQLTRLTALSLYGNRIAQLGSLPALPTLAHLSLGIQPNTAACRTAFEHALLQRVFGYQTYHRTHCMHNVDSDTGAEGAQKRSPHRVHHFYRQHFFLTPCRNSFWVTLQPIGVQLRVVVFCTGNNEIAEMAEVAVLRRLRGLRR